MRQALVLAVLLLAGACAASPEAGPDVRGFGGSASDAGPDEGRRSLNTFLSPSGEPFRGGREAPYASALWFAGADADGDGKLTAAEFRADARRFFRTLDTNGDGVLDGFEIQRYEQAVAPEILPSIGGLRGGEGTDESLFRGARGGRGGGREGRGEGGRARPARQQAGDRRPEGASLYGVLNEPEPLTAADADLSGRVTLAQWLAKTDRRFALLDDGAKGYLTLEGLPKTQAQLILERRRAEAERRRAREGGGGSPPPVAR